MQDALNKANQRVCAVVVTYNRQETLRECLRRLEQQTRPIDEIVVIDNASTDGTLDMLAREYPDVTVLPLPTNVGGAGGFHEGMKFGLTRGHDWLWLMDDDCFVERDTLRQMLEQLRENEAGVPLKRSVTTRQPVKNAPFIEASSLKHHHTGRGIPFNGFLVHREVVKAVGLPIKEFFIDQDDIEYSMRLVRLSYPIFTIPHAKLFHPDDNEVKLRIGPFRRVYHGKSPKPERLRMRMRNIVWAAKLNWTPRQLRWILKEVGVELLLALSQRDRAKLRAVLSGAFEGFRKAAPRIVYP